MNLEILKTNENWHGSYYELCFELGASGNNEKLIKALTCLWQQPQLCGSNLERDKLLDDESPIEANIDLISPRYGTMMLNDIRIGCISHVVREESGSDWLDLCIPTGMLELVFSIRYPIDYVTNLWMYNLDRVLIDIAVSVFESTPYQLAIIGEEVSGFTNSKSLTAEALRYSPALIPKSLWNSLSIEVPYSNISSELIITGQTQKQNSS